MKGIINRLVCTFMCACILFSCAGCGPYKITQAVKDEYFMLESFDSYYGG